MASSLAKDISDLTLEDTSPTNTTSSTLTTESGSSDGGSSSQSGPVNSSAPSSQHRPSTTGKSKLHPSLPEEINMRDVPLPVLGKRVNNISVRAVAEGGYSNVWQGMLDEKQLVGGRLFAQPPLIMFGRLRLSVSETSKSKRKRHNA
jgi:hypothetical protein